jgi:hypothetical protein
MRALSSIAVVLAGTFLTLLSPVEKAESRDLAKDHFRVDVESLLSTGTAVLQRLTVEARAPALIRVITTGPSRSLGPGVSRSSNFDYSWHLEQEPGASLAKQHVHFLLHDLNWADRGKAGEGIIGFVIPVGVKQRDTLNGTWYVPRFESLRDNDLKLTLKAGAYPFDKPVEVLEFGKYKAMLSVSKLKNPGK